MARFLRKSHEVVIYTVLYKKKGLTTLGEIRVCDVRNLLERVNRRGG
jgi:hypothetical protein